MATIELEELPSAGNCCTENGDNFALWGQGTLAVPIELPAEGSYTIEVVAWADQAGDELARLTIAVESDVEGTRGENAIRSKLVELYDKLLGTQVTPRSPRIEPAYQLFVEELERAREDEDTWFNPWDCSWAWDQSFFEGLLDGAVVEYEDENTGWRWNNYDWDRLNEFVNARDWSDFHHTARAWTVVLAYLLMDYRYLYL